MKYSVLFSCILVSFMCEIYANDAESSKSGAEDQLTVSVSQGLMRGVFMKSSTGRQVASFRSIPYAKPPVEGLRFHVRICSFSKQLSKVVSMSGQNR